MIREFTATAAGHATEWVAVGDWRTVEFIIDGLADASSLIVLEWRDLNGTTVRPILSAAATPATGQVSNGLYTLQIAPNKLVRLRAEDVGGSDSIYLRVTT